MNREQEVLARAMNYIDDRAILAAHAPRRRWVHAVPALAAACLCVVVIALYPFLRQVIHVENDVKGDAMPGEGFMTDKNDSADMDSDNASPESSPYLGIGIPATLGGTTITMTEVTETTVTFTVVKTDAEPLYAMFFDRQGVPLTTSEAGYKTEDGVLIRNSLHVAVNGATETVKTLPTAPGTYTVTVDFSAVRNGPYPMLEHVGLYAYAGKDGQALMTQFSLALPEENATAP